jgi:hypothetical protein
VAFGDLLLAEDAGRIDNARGRQQPENDQSQPHEFRSPIYAADYTLSLANFKGPFCRDYHASSASTKPPGRAGSHRGRALLRRDHAERGLLAGLSGGWPSGRPRVSIVPKVVFLLVWAMLNFFRLSLLRRPAVSAALSLVIIVILIQLSRLKYDIT